MLGKNIMNSILCYLKEDKVNFRFKVKVISVSNLIKYYISKDKHIVWITNCKLSMSNLNLKEIIKNCIGLYIYSVSLKTWPLLHARVKVK